MAKKITLLFAIFLQFCLLATAQTDTVLVKDGAILRNFGQQLKLLSDSTGTLKFDAVKNSGDFRTVDDAVPNLGVTNNAYWLKFTVLNRSNTPDLMLQIPLPTIDLLDFYATDLSGQTVTQEHTGDRRPYGARKFDNPIYTFRLHIPTGEARDIYLRLHGGEQLQVPLNLGPELPVLKNSQDAVIIFGLYAGLMGVMFIYNLFLYISTRDKNYLFYIAYLVIVALTQANFQGYAAKYLWPNNPWLSTYAVYILSSLTALASIEFMRNFLHTKQFVPTHHRWLLFFYLPYAIAIGLAFADRLNYGYQLIQITAMVAAIYMLYVAYLVSREGYKPATFFLVAWTIFLVGVCTFVLKDYNLLPYNTLTYNMMPLGSAIEVTLLSFALADKINVYRKEKEQSQEEALRVLQENERLIKEQNIQLERKVNERTVELQSANASLEQTLKDLKDAQSQLVDAEKMAGLGQLTAGIAHEINNPINFVTSNIKPLELDIKDLREVISMYERIDPEKELDPQLEAINSFKRQIDLGFVNDEINTLLSGIGEGARRTAEIIRSLKNFSRLDENDTKPVDLNEGLDSTLVLVRNIYPPNLQVVKNYDNLPKVECLPGKINQVFMNLISNAIYAIKNKPEQRNEEFLTITTKNLGDRVSVSIKDSGTGMTEEVKNKIFEPFFTTKSVGEGTGLGLSIVFRIIETHKGTIEVLSTINVGTEFIITLPVNA